MLLNLKNGSANAKFLKSASQKRPNKRKTLKMALKKRTKNAQQKLEI